MKPKQRRVHAQGSVHNKHHSSGGAQSKQEQNTSAQGTRITGLRLGDERGSGLGPARREGAASTRRAALACGWGGSPPSPPPLT
jgi:hypothetical protein